MKRHPLTAFRNVTPTREGPLLRTACMALVFCLAAMPYVCGLTIESVTAARAVGTGRTTGHIADLILRNDGAAPVDVELGSLYIPATGRFQGYVVYRGPAVRVPAGGQVTAPVEGYCTDVHRPPVPAGEEMISPAAWIDGAGLPDPVPGLFPLSGSAYEPLARDSVPAGAPMLTYPGTDVAFPFTLDANAHPGDAAPLFLALVGRIVDTYDRLQGEGRMRTPFSGRPERERESVIQQTLWIASGLLSGERYTKEDFQTRLYDQAEKQTGVPVAKMPEQNRDRLDKGVDDFWDAFELVGTEAKVLKATEPEPQPPAEVQEAAAPPAQEQAPAAPAETVAAPAPEPEPAPEPVPVVESNDCCDEIRAANDGRLVFTNGAQSFEIAGNRVTMTAGGKRQVWTLSRNVEALFCDVKAEQVIGELVTFSESATRGGRTAERSASVDITIAGPDRTNNPLAPSYFFSFSSSVTVDGRVQEAEFSVSLYPGTCEYAFQILSDGRLYEHLTRPPVALVALVSLLDWSTLINGGFTGDYAWWANMLSVMIQLQTWSAWLAENPDARALPHWVRAWARWKSHARGALTSLLNNAQRYSLSAADQRLIRDFLEGIDAADTPDDETLRRFLDLYTRFSGAGAGPSQSGWGRQ